MCSSDCSPVRVLSGSIVTIFAPRDLAFRMYRHKWMLDVMMLEPQIKMNFARSTVSGFVPTEAPTVYRIPNMPFEIDALWEQGKVWLKDGGAEIVDVSLPHTKYALPAYYVIAPAEASSNLARYDGVRYGHRAAGTHDLIELYEKSRAEGFGAEVQRRILIGTYVLSAGYYDAYYSRAQKVRTLIKRDFELAFEKCDVLLTPATPGPAFGLEEMTADPIAMYLNDIFTVTVNLAGLPALVVPAGLEKARGLPLGLQLIGKAFDESTVLQAGRAIERAADFAARPHRWWTA